MHDNAHVIATLNERRAKINAQHQAGFRNFTEEILRTLQAMDHPASYYSALTDAERNQERQEWRELAHTLGVRSPIKRTQQETHRRKSAAAKAPIRRTAESYGFLTDSRSTYIGTESSDRVKFMVERLPKKPYCSNDKTASHIRGISSAVNYAYIQPNSPGLAYWLVFDIDQPNAARRDNWTNTPLPNIIVGNPLNGHAHYFYCLDQPVCMTDNGRAGPKRYFKAVYDALAALLGCDAAYTGLLAKNPLHLAHMTRWLQNKPYTLGELAEHLDLESGKAWRTMRRMNQEAVNDQGRNCSLFDSLRNWAYSEVDLYRDVGDKPAWHAVCLSQAEKMNSFPGHLHGDLLWPEVKSTAKSVANWVWKNYGSVNGCSPTFSAKQAGRGRKKGAKKRDKLMLQVRGMAEGGKTHREIAVHFGIDHKTVGNWLKRAG